MTYRVDPGSPMPPSQQIVEAVLDTLCRGALGPGDRLPSVRRMASLALVNPNTVGKAYRELELRGVIEGRNGSGVFVTGAGPDHARADRLGTTLARFERAAREALRSGHDLRHLRDTLERLGAGAEQPELQR